MNTFTVLIWELSLPEFNSIYCEIIISPLTTFKQIRHPLPIVKRHISKRLPTSNSWTAPNKSYEWTAKPQQSKDPFKTSASKIDQNTTNRQTVRIPADLHAWVTKSQSAAIHRATNTRNQNTTLNLSAARQRHKRGHSTRSMRVRANEEAKARSALPFLHSRRWSRVREREEGSRGDDVRLRHR